MLWTANYYLFVFLCGSNVKADFRYFVRRTKRVQSLQRSSFVENRCNDSSCRYAWLNISHPTTMHLRAIYTLLSFNPQNNTFCFVYRVKCEADCRYCQAKVLVSFDRNIFRHQNYHLNEQKYFPCIFFKNHRGTSVSFGALCFEKWKFVQPRL